MVKIIGWIFVVYLMGSSIYSTQFHIGNYLLQKQRIKNKEVGELYGKLHKQINWKLLAFMQIAKIAIAGFILYFLLK